MTTFKEWFAENLADEAQDIAQHGADAGWPHISYTQDCVELYERFEDEIYEMLNEDAEDMGYDNVETMVSQFGRADMLSWPDGRKNLLVWYACERTAREITMETNAVAVADVAADQVIVKILPDGRVSAKDAARFTGLAAQTLANMRAQGDTSLRWSRVRNRVFYHIDDLKKFVRGS